MFVWKSTHEELMAAAARRWEAQQQRIDAQRATIRDLETALHDLRKDLEAAEAKCNQLLQEDSQRAEELRQAILKFMQILNNPFSVRAFVADGGPFDEWITLAVERQRDLAAGHPAGEGSGSDSKSKSGSFWPESLFVDLAREAVTTKMKKDLESSLGVVHGLDPEVPDKQQALGDPTVRPRPKPDVTAYGNRGHNGSL